MSEPLVASGPLAFRDPERARQLTDALAAHCAGREDDPISIMHVCGSHEQAIARFGLRDVLPAGLDLIMGPGCPVCVTDAPEIDEAVQLARDGVCVATYGDMLRVPGRTGSLADASREGARVEVVYGVAQAAELARESDEDVVFFASGFETTAVATAAVLLDDPPPNFFVLSAHKYIPPAMEIVIGMPGSRIEGFLAAGHAATITGYGVFEAFAERHHQPVVVAGFEPLDILAALVQVVRMVRAREAGVVNAYPRCVTREGNRRAQEQLWQVFEMRAGEWRGITSVDGGNLDLRPEYAAHDARRRFADRLSPGDVPDVDALAAACRCGDIMAGLARPTDCRLFGRECRIDAPVGACMVSSEGTCRIWQQYGGRPSIGALA
jgi:hydrogenase expression/formation protein HypD